MQYIVKVDAPAAETDCFARLQTLAESRLAMTGDVSSTTIARGTVASGRETLLFAMKVAGMPPSRESMRSLEKTLRGALDVKAHPHRSVEVILVDDRGA